MDLAQVAERFQRATEEIGKVLVGQHELVEATLDAAERRNATAEPQDIDEALAVDHMARSLAHDLLPEIAAKSF